MSFPWRLLFWAGISLAPQVVTSANSKKHIPKEYHCIAIFSFTCLFCNPCTVAAGRAARVWLPAARNSWGGWIFSSGLPLWALQRNETLLGFHRFCVAFAPMTTLPSDPPSRLQRRLSLLFLVFLLLSLTAKAPREVVIHYSTNSMRAYDARICSLIILGIFTPYFWPI